MLLDNTSLVEKVSFFVAVLEKVSVGTPIKCDYIPHCPQDIILTGLRWRGGAVAIALGQMNVWPQVAISLKPYIDFQEEKQCFIICL